MSSEWETCLLGSLIKHKKGSAFKSKDYQDSGVPVIRVSNFSDNTISKSDLKFVSELIAAENKDVELTSYDIVIATVGSWPNNPASVVGRAVSIPNWADGALMNQNSVILRAKTGDIIDQRFIYYQTKTEAFSHHVVSKAQGSANQASITLDVIFSFPVFWPEFSIRKDIANFLSALDDRIALLRETNATLEAIAQALFKSWFVDFDPVHANAGTQTPSLPAEIQALFPSRLVESPQGLIPEGWEVTTLDDVSEVGIGKTPPRKEQHWFSENSDDIRWVSIRDMGESGSYLASTNEYLTEEAVTRFNVRVVPNNTVMLSFKMTIGRVAISDGEMTTNEAIAHFKLTETSPLTSEFIYLHLKSFDYLTLSSTSSIADAVNSKTVKNIPIVLPSNVVLSEFQNRIEPVMQRIKVIEQQIKTVSNLRDTLLPRLISGQLPLPEAEAALAEVV